METLGNSKIFYYHFRTNWVWLLLTLLLFAFIVHCVICYPPLVYWWQVWALFGVCVYSFALWTIKYLCKHKMAVIDDKRIKIDHCRPLPWRQVAFAEFKIARCCWHRLPIIVLRPKKPLRYRYNLLQKWCAHSDFTPFSVALYALTPNDAKRITALIAQKTTLIG
mgnify:CR=1 FL=1